jgi:hypothetical protein
MEKMMSTTSDELRDDELDGVSGGIIAILIALVLPATTPPPPKLGPGPA